MSKPSDFVKAGQPCMSIFLEGWHEFAARAYLQVLAVKCGDKWEHNKTPNQIRKLWEEIPHEERCEDGNIFDADRLEHVMEKLKSENDARAFSAFWRRV